MAYFLESQRGIICRHNDSQMLNVLTARVSVHKLAVRANEPCENK